MWKYVEIIVICLVVFAFVSMGLSELSNTVTVNKATNKIAQDLGIGAKDVTVLNYIQPWYTHIYIEISVNGKRLNAECVSSPTIGDSRIICLITNPVTYP